MCGAVIAIALAVPVAGQAPLPSAAQSEPASLLAAFRTVVQNGDVEGYLRLTAPEADGQAALAFARALLGSGPASRVAVVERGRVPLSSSTAAPGVRLAVDVLIEKGPRADVYACHLDIVPPLASATSNPAGQMWRILAAERLTSVEGLERLSIDPSTQYRALNLVIKAEDVEIRLPEGRVFVVRSGGQLTAAVLVGEGDMTFAPSSPVERGQVRIFSGADTLRAQFEGAYLRFSPLDADRLLRQDALTPETVDRQLLNRSTEIFNAESDKSFVVNIGDLSPERWWVQPLSGDLVAEVRTKKYGTLTYARSWQAHEDVTLFDRQRRRHIALYASPDKLAARGRFYSESDGRDYEVLHYDVDATFVPDRLWIQGRTRLSVKVLTDNLTRVSLRLADSLEVESVWTAQHGRVLGLRVQNRNTLVVALPKPAALGSTLDVVVAYKGRLSPQSPELEGRITPGSAAGENDDSPPGSLEASFLYSNRSYWYAQADEEGYSTARMTLRVPTAYTCVASGELLNGAPSVSGVVGQSGPSAPQRVYTFEAARPIKYLAFVASRLTHLEPDVAAAASPGSASPATGQASGATTPLRLSAEVSARFRSEGQEVMAQAASMARVYTEIAGACPYPAFALALVEDDLPGGHSPAYFAMLQKVGRSGRSNLKWSSDPSAFPDYPEYFLAHELAHQWWGQAVGPKNYHEQWISEGFAQYFAALYTERIRGVDAYRAIIRQFRKSTMDRSADGPIHLGSRLGHLQGDSRVFRALVYNKGALVLHMLRLMLGDDAFFRSIRRFYAEFQFRHAGTEDVRRVFEAEAGRSLERFFEGWVYGETLPTLAITTTIEPRDGGSAVTIRAEQGPLLFDVPVTVALKLADGSTRTIIVSLADRVTERLIFVEQPVRRAAVVNDELAARLREG
ncbi:MAG: M1 family aminopeptidase [Acidobacteria bacterium]|nr:M1 family aminopeptidase [Acidobacteriota bacterium]